MSNKQIDILGKLILEIARLLFKKRRKVNMSNFDIPDFLKKNKNNIVVEEEKVEGMSKPKDIASDEPIKSNQMACPDDVKEGYKMSNAQKEKLVQMAESLNREEIEIVLDCIPVEMMFNKIGQELERNRKFFAAINGAITNY